jgi:hypothetical protein
MAERKTITDASQTSHCCGGIGKRYHYLTAALLASLVPPAHIDDRR